MGPRAAPMKPGPAVVLGAVIIIIGAVVTAIFGRLVLREKEVQKWRNVNGTIVSSEMTAGPGPGQADIRDSEGRHIPVHGRSVFKAEITYTYKVKEKEYTGTDVDLGDETSTYDFVIQDMVNKYPEGAKARVYFNPENPAEAILDNGYGAGLYIPLAGGFFFVIMGIAGTYSAAMELLKEKKKAAGT